MRLFYSCLFLMVCGLSAHSYSAENALPWGLSASGQMSLWSNFKDHGISKTNNNAGISGNIKLQHTSGIYGNLWAVSLSQEDASIELHSELGFYRDIADYAVDAGIRRVSMPCIANSSDNEAYASLTKDSFLMNHHSMGIGITANSDNQFVSINQSYEINPQWSINNMFEYAFDKQENWINYQLGTAYTIDTLELGVFYMGTNIKAQPLADNRVVVSLSKYF